MGPRAAVCLVFPEQRGCPVVLRVCRGQGVYLSSLGSILKISLASPMQKLGNLSTPELQVLGDEGEI